MTDFILNGSKQSWFDDAFTWYHCQFALPSYTDALYIHYNVPFPSKLDNAVVKRRAEYLAGRYCALTALSELGIETRNLESGAMRNPLWPSGVIGAISHSANRAVAVVSLSQARQGLGVDIEKIIDTEKALSLRSQILSADEIALFEHYPADGGLLFSLAFSTKESFFKAAFPTVERYFGFSAVAIRAIDFGNNRLDGEVTESPHPRFPNGSKFCAKFAQLDDEMIATFVELT